MITKDDLKFKLEKDLNEGVQRLFFAIKNVTGKDINFNVQRADKFRILNFMSWSERYYISVEDILNILLPIWQKKFKSNSKGLGIRLSLLCGPKSKEIIKSYIKKHFPNGEHIKLHKQKIRDSLLDNSLPEFESPIDYIKNYRSTISNLRNKDAALSLQMQRRQWRDNPFT